MSISVTALDARKAGEQPFEFEYTDSEGTPTGIWLSVYGSHTDKVQNAVNVAVNERRKKEAHTEALNRGSRPGSAGFTPIEDDVAFGQRLAAVRLCGWRGDKDIKGLKPDQAQRFVGLTEPFSPELALQLCQSNPELAAQVTDEANRTTNFLKLSPPK
jgi:hypothetical protein